MSSWSAAHNNCELLMGEAGCSKQAPSRPDRLAWYATVAAAARASYASHLAIWDDDGEHEHESHGGGRSSSASEPESVCQ